MESMSTIWDGPRVDSGGFRFVSSSFPLFCASRNDVNKTIWRRPYVVHIVVIHVGACVTVRVCEWKYASEVRVLLGVRVSCSMRTRGSPITNHQQRCENFFFFLPVSSTRVPADVCEYPLLASRPVKRR